MRILVNQPRLTPELALESGVQATDFFDLLRQADFVSLHVPFSHETEAIIGPVELGLMKSSALLVNMGHTDLIDEAALLEALDAGRIARGGAIRLAAGGATAVTGGRGLARPLAHRRPTPRLGRYRPAAARLFAASRPTDRRRSGYAPHQ